MAITDRSKDMAFKPNRIKLKVLEDIEQVELAREDKEIGIIQARLHYENAYHALTRSIVATDNISYSEARENFLKASDVFYKLQHDRINKEKKT